MRHPKHPLAAGLIAGAALTACSASPPTRFYVLDEVAPAAAPAPLPAASPPVRLEPPLIGAEMDRPELVTRSGANRVHVAAFDRWAAPLDAQVQRVLAEDLAAQLPPGALLSAEIGRASCRERVLCVV